MGNGIDAIKISTLAIETYRHNCLSFFCNGCFNQVWIYIIGSRIHIHKHGDCPEKCNDGNSCTIDAKTGSAENCNVSCTYQEITECAMADGCCPSGCNAVLDDDCSAKCGNGVIEPGETCDGDCRKSCDDESACTIDTLTGSEENCNVACSYQVINACEYGDGLWFDGGELTQLLKQLPDGSGSGDSREQLIGYLGELFAAPEQTDE